MNQEQVDARIKFYVDELRQEIKELKQKVEYLEATS